MPRYKEFRTLFSLGDYLASIGKRYGGFLPTGKLKPETIKKISSELEIKPATIRKAEMRYLDDDKSFDKDYKPIKIDEDKIKSMDSEQPVAWITRGGKHIPIFDKK